ncbi:hypothetical protein [Kingella potus]|uniref:hypothetical protein n=1 Tax=Kingella potus TaxID=265175 RepID=UPI001FD3CFCC|nr:hypothetical protein [Kingella potus]UOO99855.1 hypothetical protein LVJ84_07105 [Kingella potus]
MKYIHTTGDTLEYLKKQAKKQQAKHGGQMAALLGTAAKEAGYQNWSHAQACHAAGERYYRTPLTEECYTLAEHVRRGEDYVTATGFETAEPSAFLLFSTDLGDGWLYDVFTRQALCLIRRNRECPVVPIRYEGKRFIIEWDGETDQTTPIPSLMPATEAARAKLGAAYIFPEYVGLMLDDLGRQAERQARAFHSGTEADGAGQGAEAV